jgi:metallophosphoesterase superfamily enzyme
MMASHAHPKELIALSCSKELQAGCCMIRADKNRVMLPSMDHSATCTEVKDNPMGKLD